MIECHDAPRSKRIAEAKDVEAGRGGSHGGPVRTWLGDPVLTLQSGRWECRDLVSNDSRSPVVIPEMSAVATLASCMLDAANHAPRGPKTSFACVGEGAKRGIPTLRGPGSCEDPRATDGLFAEKMTNAADRCRIIRGQ